MFNKSKILNIPTRKLINYDQNQFKGQLKDEDKSLKMYITH